MNDTKAEEAARPWLAYNCPNAWGLLNARAKCVLPPGLVAYLTTDGGRDRLAFADHDVAALVRICGAKRVGDAFRRDLSNIGSAPQLAELLCELTVAAAVGRLAKNLELRPATENGKRCDFVAKLAGQQVYGEVKRYEDSFPMDDQMRLRTRSIVRLPAGTEIPEGVERPRGMDLASKLEEVPEQFPSGTVNILFVDHCGVADTHRSLQSALFGESWYFAEPDSVGRPAPDGLFARDSWGKASACYLVRLTPGPPHTPARALYCLSRRPRPRRRARAAEQARFRD